MKPDSCRRMHPTPRWSQEDLLLVAILTVTALVLRLRGLNEGLWVDEIETLLVYVRLPVGEIIEDYSSWNNHVLYSVVAHYSVEWFGESARALRLPAALFGVASIAAAYHLGRQLTSRYEALLTSTLLVFSYHHVWLSQNARGYTGLLLGTILLSIYFVRILTAEKSEYPPVIAYAIIAALTCWIHLTAALVVLAHGVIWLLMISPMAGKEKTGSKLVPLLGLIMAGILSLALYAPVLKTLLSEFLALQIGTGESSPGTSAETLPENPATWQSVEWVLTEMWNAALTAVPGGSPIVLLGILTIVVGTWSYMKQGILPAALLMVPPLVTGIMVAQFSPVFFPRFLSSSMVFFLLLAVRGGFVLTQAALPRLKARQIMIVGLMFALATVYKLPAAWKPKQNFVAAMNYIEEQRDPGDAVVCGRLTFRPLNLYLGMNCERTESVSELSALEKRNSRIWFLYTLPIKFRHIRPELWQRLQEDYAPIKTFKGTLAGGDIVIMLKSDAEAPREKDEP